MYIFRCRRDLEEIASAKYVNALQIILFGDWEGTPENQGDVYKPFSSDSPTRYNSQVNGMVVGTQTGWIII